MTCEGCRYFESTGKNRGLCHASLVPVLAVMTGCECYDGQRTEEEIWEDVSHDAAIILGMN